MNETYYKYVYYLDEPELGFKGNITHTRCLTEEGFALLEKNGHHPSFKINLIEKTEITPSDWYYPMRERDIEYLKTPRNWTY